MLERQVERVLRSEKLDDLVVATGDDSEYFGFGPNGRLSGAEGMTLYPDTQGFHLDVILQQVVVQ